MSDAFDDADCYDCNEFAEAYPYTTPRQAVYAIADAFAEHAEITVYAFKRIEWPEAEWIAKQVLDALEHELGEYIDPDNGIDWAPQVKLAADKLANEVRKRHKPWHCEQVASRTMSIAKWRRYG